VEKTELCGREERRVDEMTRILHFFGNMFELRGTGSCSNGFFVWEMTGQASRRTTGSKFEVWLGGSNMRTI
jgi:hypothetical protein